MKGFRYLVAGLASLGLIATAGTQASAAGPTHFTINKNEVYAGWSVHPPSGTTTEAAASWKVPQVQCSAPLGSRAWKQSRAAMWVGIWGQNPASSKSWLAQTGTVSQCLNGGVYSYTAFAEMFPQPQKTLSVQVHPGDEIWAGITYRGRVAAGKDKGKLKFTFNIVDHADYPSGQATADLYTSQNVLVKDAAWQGGAIVEQEPNGESGVFAIGGLAKLSTPASFSSVGVNGYRPYQYSGSALHRWDMYNTVYRVHHPPTLGTELLASTGADTATGFQVTWKNWN